MAGNKKGVPGIPQGALDSIQDENTRQVLQAIVDGWNVRNGATGDGNSRFVTADELGDQVNKAVISGLPSTYGVPSGKNTLGGLIQYITSLLADLQAEVLKSELWRKLGERIQLVDIPQIFTKIGNVETVINNEIIERRSADDASIKATETLGVRVGENESGLTSEKTLRVNSDNALADSINKIWATVGGNTALVSGGESVAANNLGAVAEKWNQVQATIKDPVTGAYVGTAAVRDESRVEVSKVKGILAVEKTVKVDINGYVAGYGIIATEDMRQGGRSSAFGVRADQFFIGSPIETLGINPQGMPDGAIPPFIVTTRNYVLNGRTVPPGVYINTAAIANGTIGTAQIGIAAVETLSIAGNAVTVSTYDENVSYHGWGGGTTLDTTPVTVCSTNLTIGTLGDGVQAGTIITGYTTLYEGGGSNAAIETRLYVDGVQIAIAACTLGESKTTAVTGFKTLTQGSHTIEIKICCASGLGSPTKDLACISGLICMSGKR